jgi:hypothetical protein
MDINTELSDSGFSSLRSTFLKTADLAVIFGLDNRSNDMGMFSFTDSDDERDLKQVSDTYLNRKKWSNN